MLRVTKDDQEIMPLVLWAIDPFDERSYIPDDKTIWIFGWFALVWNIAGGRKHPLVWSDLWSRLPFRLITYPSIRWVGNRLRPM